MGLFRRRGRAVAEPDLLDDEGLTATVEAFEAARADSDVLAEAAAAGVVLDRPLLVRHHLLLPGLEAVQEAAAILDDDGYRVLAAPGSDAATLWPVRASRTQLVTALGMAQERSRMAGLAQRLGGDTLGWDAVAPERPDPR